MMKHIQHAWSLLGALALGLGPVATALAREVPPIQRADTLPASTPWDLDALSKPPGFEWSEGKEVRSLFYKGEPYQGKPTRVFAYYATPGSLAGDPSLDKDLPGIVLVHGGGGTAFPHWAKLWASRGYAAIAMDLGIRGPADEKILADGGPSQKDSVKFATGQPPTDQWTYHAVADVVRAHSLLLSFDEVDQDRTAVTGISWGGYLTCIVAGLDNRFKAAAPVYGCGFLHENSVWLKTLQGMNPGDRETWVRLWDPSMYVGSATMPMLFANGGTDFAYPPDSHARTYALVTSPKKLHFAPHLAHGHIFDKPNAIGVFMGHHLKGGKPLPAIGPVEVGEKQVVAPLSSETKLLKAGLHFTVEDLRGDARSRKWTSRPATIAGDSIRSELPPAEATAWFLTLTDERNTLVSSTLSFPPDAQGHQDADAHDLPLTAGQAAERIALFNGKDLTGWDGAEGWWGVEDGALTSESTPGKPCKTAHYLVWTGGQPGDFQLDCEFKLSAKGNSGIHIRSERRPGHDMFGYQADMTGEGGLIGFIYHHKRGLVAKRGEKVMISREGKREAEAEAEAAKLLDHYKPGEWNHYRIVCRDDSITLHLNGVKMCDIVDRDPATAVTRGFIGLQMHPGPPMKVQFREIFLTPLPPAKPATP